MTCALKSIEITPMRINSQKLLFFPFTVFFGIAGLGVSPALSSPAWEKMTPVPSSAGPWTAVLAHPLEGQGLIVASRHEIFENQAKGTWRVLWNTERHRSIRRLLYFKEMPRTLFILTDKGAFQLDLISRQSKEIFRGRSDSEGSILSFTVLPNDSDHWFLGTEAGLFESDDAGKTWFRFEKFLAREPIPILDMTQDQLFLSTSERLYVSEDLASFRAVFSLESGDDKEFLEIEETLEEFQGLRTPTAMNLSALIHSGDGEHLWLGTRKGVFESRDGRQWQVLPRSGFRSADVSQLLWSPKSKGLLATTSHGIYRYLFSSGRWEELYQGLAKPEVLSVALLLSSPEILVASTPEGLFRYELAIEGGPHPPLWNPSDDKLRLFQELLALEPSARELHKAVIRAGDLSNAKIKRWHGESRLASLLPTFSFGRDFSTANNIDLDRGSTSDQDQFITGPSDEDRGWDMDVSWNLGNFIWSTDQTSIDSRSKLMVELRSEFLAEATRIYYERRRLQMEIVFSPATSEAHRLERLIRMDELTALLDGMTDGYMTKKLEKIYRQNAKFSKLWEYTN